MERFNKMTALAMPLAVTDVDTDQIIPAQYLTSTSREGYGENLFRRLRDSDPSFPLNQAKYRNAKILIADSNFGCGSSREHAVWALLGAGFRCVIAKSFADIFFGNSAKNGLVLVILQPAVVDELLAAAAKGLLELTIDLQSQQVITPSHDSHTFAFDPFRKHCIMNGLEDLDYLLSHQKEIEAFRKRQAGHVFYSTLSANNP